MDTVHGIAVFPGVAIGPAFVLDRDGLRIPTYFIPAGQAASELAHLDACLAQIAADIAAHETAVKAKLGAEVARIFEAHRAVVQDPHLRARLAALVEGMNYSAEHAVHTVLGEYATFFRGLKGSHFADRASDVVDLERQILRGLLGDRLKQLAGVKHEVVVLARDLTPGETASFDATIVRGLATETGGQTSHTAIVAGAMELPAVVGLGSLPDVADGQLVIVDGNRGVLIVEPDQPTLQKYHAYARDQKTRAASWSQLRNVPAETLDGERVLLFGNIEFPYEARHCVERGADGVGLYRTEFLYLSRTEPPTEEDHFRAYVEVLQTVGPDRPVTFRTLDLGADKIDRNSDRKPEANPFLGLRSVRLSLRNKPMFVTQLRAMLRASVYGDVRIMFPLVSTLRELRSCKLILREVMDDLAEAEVPFRRDIAVGMMVEVPSAAVMADEFAQEVAFFSIGTNDLIQYTLAVDRTNQDVAPLYNASDPAVLRLVRDVAAAARRRGIAVNVCGEMSGDSLYTALFLGLGIRSLSVSPHNLPSIKQTIRGIAIADAELLAERVLEMETAADITKFLSSRLPDRTTTGASR